MIKAIPVAVFALIMAGCGGEQKAAPVEETASKLDAGLYELTAEVTQLDSTDNTKPATALKLGDKQVIKACVLADGKPTPELLAEQGDKCEVKNSYIRNGRMSVEMSCTRANPSGPVMPAMNGSFKADSFEGEITTMTYFYKNGDYRLSRKVSAKRVGDCPAAGAAKKA